MGEPGHEGVNRRNFLKMTAAAAVGVMFGSFSQSASADNKQKIAEKTVNPEAIRQTSPLEALADLVKLPDLPTGSWRLFSSLRDKEIKPGVSSSFRDYSNPDDPDDFNRLIHPSEGGYIYYQVDKTSGKPEYPIVPDLQGKGLITSIWVAYDNPAPSDTPEALATGNITKIGNIKMSVGPKVIFNTPAADFFWAKQNPLTGCLLSTFPLTGGCTSLIPLPHQETGRLALTAPPKWFGVETVSLPQNFPLENIAKNSDVTLTKINQIKSYPERMPELNGYQKQSFTKEIVAQKPLTLELKDQGSVAGIHIRVAKGQEDKVKIRINYLDDSDPSKPAIEMPLKDFFGTSRKLTYHHDYALGIIEEEQTNFFYSNLAIPFGKKATISFINDSGDSIKVETSIFLSSENSNYRLRSWQGEKQKLNPGDPDYEVNLKTTESGKLAVLFFEVDDYDQQSSPNPKWPFAFMESNVQINIDGQPRGTYTGLEDIAHGGYFWRGKATTDQIGNPISGGPLGMDQEKWRWCTIFRFFGLSSIPFERELKLRFGHGYEGGKNGNNLAVTYQARGFWYEKK